MSNSSRGDDARPTPEIVVNADAPPDRMSSRVAHNALLNIIGVLLPVGLAVFLMPVVARLGPARFGLLGLAWAITEYLLLFDLGLGRAIVRFVAASLHDRPEEISGIASFGVATQVIAGTVGGALFYSVVPVLVHRVFTVPPAIQPEAIGMFRVVAVSLPVILLLSTLRAVLEGAERFDLSNAIKILSSAAAVVIPALGAHYGLSLPAIMAFVLVSRAVIVVLYGIAVRRALPMLHWAVPREWRRFKAMLSFGGWVATTSAISPILVYLDRFTLASVTGIAAVGFYTAPYEGVARLLVVPVALIGSLLPALTSLEARRQRDRLSELAGSAVRVLAVVMAPALATIFAFAPILLTLWLGPAYAAQSTIAVRILAIGVLANAIAHAPFVTLYALNRPDIPAKFHILELAIHVPLTYLLVRSYGISGAAAAWAIRTTLDLSLLLWAAGRQTGRSLPAVLGGTPERTAAALVILFGMTGIAAWTYPKSVPVSAALEVLAIASFLALSWWWVLKDVDRAAVASIGRAYERYVRRGTLVRASAAEGS